MPDKKIIPAVSVAKLQQDAPEEMFRTKNIGLAAALIRVGHELLRLDRQDPPDPYEDLFVFRHTDDIDDLVNAYMQNDLTVPAHAYVHTFEMLIGKLHGE